MRVGCAMSAVWPAPFGMSRASAFVYVRSMTFQPSACAVAGPVVGVLRARERVADLLDGRVDLVRRHLLVRRRLAGGGAGGAGSRPARLR